MSTEAFAGVVAGISPVGVFWSGPAADRFRAGIVEAMRGVVEFLCTLHTQMTPMSTEHREVLQQWLDYLSRVDCVVQPTDLEELRALVVALLGASSSIFTAGLSEQILAYLPLVVVHDDRPVSLVPLEIPAPVDGGRATIAIWYSALEDNDPLTIDCVGRALAPAVSTIRLVTPGLVFYNQSGGSLAGDLTLFWREMTASNKVAVELYNGAVLVDSGLIAGVDEGEFLASDVLSSTPAGTNVSGYRLDVVAEVTWAGGARVVLTDSYTWP